MAENNENIILMSAKEAASVLGIQNSTLRKYSQMLEKSGYRIHKNELGHRGFFPKDIAIIKRIVEISKSDDMTLDMAINSVVSMVGESQKSDSDTTEIVESPYITMDDFKAYQRKQMELQKAMYDEFKTSGEKQSELIKDLVNRLERQEEINKRIETLEEEKQQLLEKQEVEKEVAVSADTSKKKSWWQIFLGK